MTPIMCVTVCLGVLATLQITYVMSQSTECRQQLDICVVIDTSDLNLESFDGLRTMKRSLKNYLRMYDIGPGNNNDQVGICLYGTESSTPVILGEEQDINLIEQKIGGVDSRNFVTGFSVQGGFVNTHLGLQCCHNMLATRGRFNRRDLTVVMALGNTESRLEHQAGLVAEEIKKTGHLSVVTIGTRFTNVNEFESYASDAESFSSFSSYSSLLEDSLNTPHMAYNSWCPNLMYNPCENCRWDNGIGYAMGSECWEYYQCIRQDNLVIPRLLKTAYGTFWDNNMLAMREPSTGFRCPIDRCQLLPSGAQYGRADNCRIYMECHVNNPSTYHIGCCAQGMRFVQGLGCIEDASCDDNCTLSEPLETGACYLSEVPGHPDRFRHANIEQFCAPGTYFSRGQCGCVHLHSTLNVCEPELDLFMDSEGVRDISRNKYSLINEGVFTRHLGNGQYSAVFHNAALKVLGLANQNLRDKFTIYMKIQSDSTVHVNESIVSNSDCERGSETYAVLLDNVQNFRTAKGFLDTYPHGRTETEPILLANDGIIDLVYSYNGESLSMLVRDNLGGTEEFGPPAPGLIVHRQPSCAMTIGNSLAYNAFEGEILKLKVFIGCQRERLDDYLR